MVNVKNAAELCNQDYVVRRLSAVHRELAPDLLQADYEQVRLELAEENIFLR